jgi:hypothetical protein
MYLSLTRERAVEVTLIVPGVNGSDTTDIHTDYRSLAPRFGFAYTAHPNTVIRGGFGLVFFRDNTGPSVPFADLHPHQQHAASAASGLAVDLLSGRSSVV